MSKKTRKILFLVCLFLFFLAAPLIILYSLGYRFDFENRQMTQTGGFGFKVKPKQAEIYIDGKLAKKTDFLVGSALVENLLPRKYKIEVKKEGYLTWEKNLKIKEKEVVEIRNIILFPKKINVTVLTKGVENFWFSPDEKKIILLEIGEDGEGWALKLYDLERNIKSHLISEEDVNQNGAHLLNLEFSEDSKEVYLDTKVAEISPDSILEDQEKTFILRLDKLPVRLTEKEIATSSKNIITSKIYNQDVYYLDDAGYVLKNELRINETPFPVKPGAEYTLEIFPDFIFLVAEDRTLHLFSPESKSFESFFYGVNNLKISPDNKKLAFFSNSEVWILFLKDEGIKKAGEKIFLVRLSENISDVFWLNPDYLVLNSGSNLKIVEIDERDKIQTWDIASTQDFDTVKEIYFIGDTKKLYISSEENLFASEELF